MSLLSKIVKGVKSVAKAVAPVAAVIPGPWQAPAAIYTAARAARAVTSSMPGAGVMSFPPPQGDVFGQPSMAGILPSLPSLGGILGRGASMLPAVVGGARTAIGVGRGLAGAAARWCQRNPKTCAALGGAGIVADMMRTGEIKRPGRRINPMNVRAMRRAIRRVKAGRKIARQIEMLLPHRRSSSSMVHATPSRLFHAKR